MSNLLDESRVGWCEWVVVSFLFHCFCFHFTFFADDQIELGWGDIGLSQKLQLDALFSSPTYNKWIKENHKNVRNPHLEDDLSDEDEDEDDGIPVVKFHS
jgi:hypothetical protein